MLRTSAVALILVMSVMFAGCSGSDGADPDGGDGNGDGDGGNQTHPAPSTVVSRSQQADDIPMAPNPYVADFTIEEPYDELLVVFHVSGVGSYRFTIAGPDDDMVHDTGDQTSASEPDSHSTHAQGVTLEAVPGDYTAQVAFTGGITYHLTVFAKLAGGNETEPHDH